MIRIFKNSKDVRSILECIKANGNYNFYFTDNNQRVFVDSEASLKKILRGSSAVFVDEREDEIKGVIAVWKSKGAGIDRNYLKFSCEEDNLPDLLTVLLWDFKKELCIKLDKNSNLINIFREKGFKFSGDRGNQSLLKRYAIYVPKRDMINSNGEYREKINDFDNRQNSQPYRREYQRNF